MLRRKLLIGTLIIVNAVFFQGCSKTIESISQEQFDKVEVLEMYNEAAEKIESFSTVKVKMNTDFFINDGSNSLQLNMVTDIQQIKNANSIEMEIESSTKYLDKEINSISYYKDGFFYTDFDNQKVKYNIDEYNMKNDNFVFLTKIKNDQVKSFIVEKNEDGSKNITLVVDPEVVAVQVKKYITGLMNAEKENVKVSNYRISILVDSDNLIKSCDTLISLINDTDNEKMEYAVDSYMEYCEINGDFDINFPDLGNYYEFNINN